MEKAKEKPSLTPEDLAAKIDHTLLKPEAGPAAVEQWCEEAMKYGFITVCVFPCYVKKATEKLAHYPTRVGSVVGFPFGTSHSKIKVAEAQQAVADGARELDLVINLPATLAGDFDYLKREVTAVKHVCQSPHQKVTLKMILETAALPVETKIALCKLCSEAGVDFIKTSTGLHPAGGATIEDVKLLYAHRGKCKIKAAGGISDLKTALTMLVAGAERIGTSSSVTIIQELINR